MDLFAQQDGCIESGNSIISIKFSGIAAAQSASVGCQLWSTEMAV